MIEKLSTKKTIIYSLANSGGLVLYSVFNAYIIFFYTDVVGVAPRIVGSVWFVFAFWNAINDLISGITSDSILRRVKKRAFFIKYLTIPLALSFVLIWNPIIDLKNTSYLITFVYIFVSICLFDVFYSFIALNQFALFPKLFKAGPDRPRAASIYSFMGNALAGVSIILAPIIYESFLGWRGMSLILSFVSILFLMTSLSVIGKINSESSKEVINLKTVFQILRVHKKLIALICSDLSIRFILAIIGTLIPFYTKYVLQDSQTSTSLLTGAVLVSGITGIFLWQKVYGKIGVINGSFISLALGFFAFIPFIFVSSINIAVVFIIILGFVVGGAMFLTPDLLYSKLVDEDYEKTKSSREGIFAGIIGFTNRFPPALVGIIFGEILSISKFNSDLLPFEQPDSVANYIRLFMVFGSILAILLCLFALRIFKRIDDKD